MNKSKVKTMTRSLYDLQKLRMQMGGRLVANFREKIGIESGKKESDDDKGKKILKTIEESYEKITDGIAEISGRYKFNYDGIISNYAELILVDNYLKIKDREEKGFKRLKHLLKEIPIYTEFLEKVKGIGKAMSGVIISEIDIRKAKYPSSLWKYSGLDVVNGEGRSRKKKHLVEQEYKDKNGDTQIKKGISFNPFLKTKLVGVLGSCFLRTGKDNSKYAKIYYDYKHRIQNMDRHSDKSDGHIHNMSIRYMIKMFLKDLYLAWRKLEGLKVSKPYHEKKLGHKHNE